MSVMSKTKAKVKFSSFHLLLTQELIPNYQKLMAWNQIWTSFLCKALLNSSVKTAKIMYLWDWSNFVMYQFHFRELHKKFQYSLQSLEKASCGWPFSSFSWTACNQRSDYSYLSWNCVFEWKGTPHYWKCVQTFEEWVSFFFAFMCASYIIKYAIL